MNTTNDTTSTDAIDTQRAVSDLLAIVHRDGGHYESQHGTEKAAKDAVTLWYANAAKLDTDNHELAECYRLSGADPDSNEDWRLAPNAVQAVRELRAEYDSACRQLAEPSEVRAELTRLRETLADVKVQAERICSKADCFQVEHRLSKTIRERIERHERGDAT